MAATVVDQLVVTLDLDSSKFMEKIAQVKQQLKELGIGTKSVAVSTAGLGKQLKVTGEEGRKATAKMSRGMGRARMAVLALTAVVVKLNAVFGLPALKSMTQDVVDTEASTLRLARSLQVNSTELQGWQKAVQLQGGDVGSFNSSLLKMSANLGKVGTDVRGAKMLQQYFGIAGVTDAMVKGKDVLQVMSLFATQMRQMSTEQQRMVGKKLGMDEADIRLIQEGGAALMYDVNAMKQLAATNGELQNAKEVAHAQALANMQWERAKQILASSFLPALRTLASMLSQISEWAKKHAEVVRVAAIVIGSSLAALGVAMTAASFVILAAGLRTATGMTLATGGLWMVGVTVGIAALIGLAVAAESTASAYDKVADAHERVANQQDRANEAAQKELDRRKLEITYAEQYRDAVEKLNAQIEKTKSDIRESKASGSTTTIRGGRLGGVHVGIPREADPSLVKHQAVLEETLAALSRRESYRTGGAMQAQYARWSGMGTKEAIALAHNMGTIIQKEADVKINSVYIQVGEHGAADEIALRLSNMGRQTGDQKPKPGQTPGAGGNH